MKMLSIMVEATNEDEIIFALEHYLENARNNGLFSMLTDEGPNGEGAIMSYQPDYDGTHVRDTRKKIEERQKEE